MRILVAGDTHGNTPFVENYLYPRAVALGVDHILQLGDFGYWEHEPPGVQFLDVVESLAARSQIPMYWLHGNHDKHSVLLDKYKRRTIEGFIPVREHVFYLPQGVSWMWEDGVIKPYAVDSGRAVTARVFGGAYSIDKELRLRLERQRGKPGAYWFPEEQMSDADMDEMLAADSDPRTIIFSHDKPRSANAGIPLKDLQACHENQDRLQRALLAHRPALWMHGHLHHRYIDRVRSGDETTTGIIGLGCDDQASDRPQDSWAVLEIDGNQVGMMFSDSALLELSEDDLDAARGYLI